MIETAGSDAEDGDVDVINPFTDDIAAQTNIIFRNLT